MTCQYDIHAVENYISSCYRDALLSYSQTRRWMQSQLAKAIHSLQDEKPKLFQNLKITLSYGGPAVTLKVKNYLAAKGDEDMDIDVVICVQHEDLENGQVF